MDKLANHRKIAFDLDGTLIDGAASPALATFIKSHPTKSFSIVTFRTPQQSSTIPAELQNHGLSADLFRNIISMPQRLVFDFDEDQQFRRNAAMPSFDHVTPDALLPGEYKFMNWKGFIANKLGATVLVDDMPNLVALGCKKFHVTLVDATKLGKVIEAINFRYVMRIIKEATDPFSVRVVPDDTKEIPSHTAAVFRRSTKEILIRQSHASNQHIMNHEIGHALFDHVQPVTIIDAFQYDDAAWAEFLHTSTARSYQTQHEHQTADERNNPRLYDWVEAIADLWMEYQAGRLDHYPALVHLLLRLQQD
jgi:FMN phosphatase YigB (HAD superfamily)